VKFRSSERASDRVLPPSGRNYAMFVSNDLRTVVARSRLAEVGTRGCKDANPRLRQWNTDNRWIARDSTGATRHNNRQQSMSLRLPHCLFPPFFLPLIAPHCLRVAKTIIPSTSEDNYAMNVLFEYNRRRASRFEDNKPVSDATGELFYRRYCSSRALGSVSSGRYARYAPSHVLQPRRLRTPCG
jgi:hypothetical protein